MRACMESLFRWCLGGEERNAAGRWLGQEGGDVVVRGVRVDGERESGWAEPLSLLQASWAEKTRDGTAMGPIMPATSVAASEHSDAGSFFSYYFFYFQVYNMLILLIFLECNTCTFKYSAHILIYLQFHVMHFQVQRIICVYVKIHAVYLRYAPPVFCRYLKAEEAFAKGNFTLTVSASAPPSPLILRL
jgi:hypothetical protein